jgi:hypothetical protein
MRRKGELSPSAVDSGWPYQIVLPARLCGNGGYKEIHDFSKHLSLCSRGHAVFHDGQWLHVYCFKEPADAELFMRRFGGEKFNPKERGRGQHWAYWNRAKVP